MQVTTFIPAILLVANLTACLPQEKSATAPVTAKKPPENFMISTLPALPGWDIKESKGMYCQMFRHIGEDNYGAQFRQAMAAIEEEGKKSGAQALINFKVTAATYEVQGAKWSAATVNLCGDFVVLA